MESKENGIDVKIEMEDKEEVEEEIERNLEDVWTRKRDK